MFIQTEATPNPQTLKFLPGRPVLDSGAADFETPDSAESSPLARRLFAVEGIRGVFLGGDFITATKDEGRDWQTLKTMLLSAIMEHFTSGEPVMLAGASVASGHAQGDGENAEIVAQIKELLDTRVRPMVARDGGDIVFHGFDRGVVYLTMRGACSGCPSSTATLKHGIENMLRHFIPEVQSVEAVN